jgi:hypothetical protein
VRTLVYSLNAEDRARLCASPLPRNEAIFQQLEIDELYKIVNYDGKRVLCKNGDCVMITPTEIPQSVMIQTAVASVALSHPEYLKEILAAYNSISR